MITSWPQDWISIFGSIVIMVGTVLVARYGGGRAKPQGQTKPDQVTIPAPEGSVKVDLTNVSPQLAIAVSTLTLMVQSQQTELESHRLRIDAQDEEIQQLQTDLRRAERDKAIAHEDLALLVTTMETLLSWARDGAEPPPPGIDGRIAVLINRHGRGRAT